MGLYGQAMTTEGLKSLAFEIARANGVDPDMLAAIVQVESGWSPWVVRYEPAFAYFSLPDKWARIHCITELTERQMQRMSWGLTQVMGTVCREVGFREMLTQMCEPENALTVGCKVLKRKMARYTNELDIIASYNAGSAIKVTDEKYRNQEYVDKVSKELQHIRQLKG